MITIQPIPSPAPPVPAFTGRVISAAMFGGLSRSRTGTIVLSQDWAQ